MITEWHPQSRGVNTNLPETLSDTSNIGDKPPIPETGRYLNNMNARKNGRTPGSDEPEETGRSQARKTYWKQKAREQDKKYRAGLDDPHGKRRQSPIARPFRRRWRGDDGPDDGSGSGSGSEWKQPPHLDVDIQLGSGKGPKIKAPHEF